MIVPRNPVDPSLETPDGDSVIAGRNITEHAAIDGVAGVSPRFSGLAAKWSIHLAGDRRRSVALIATLAVLTVLCSTCSEDQPKLASGKIVYQFLANAQSAQIPSYNRANVNFGNDITIDNQKRATMYEHPVAEVRFDNVVIPNNAVLQFGIGINPQVWDKTGDGVTFEITVVDEKSAKTQIFSRYIDPKSNSGDRKWFDQDVDLKDFAGQKVSLVFATTPGPRGDAGYDWACWSNPVVRLRDDPAKH